MIAEKLGVSMREEHKANNDDGMEFGDLNNLALASRSQSIVKSNVINEIN